MGRFLAAWLLVVGISGGLGLGPAWAQETGVMRGSDDGTTKRIFKTTSDGTLLMQITNEADPQVGTVSTNALPKWDGGALVTSNVTDNGTTINAAGTLTMNILRVPNSTAPPAACTVGDLYFDTDATSGRRVYACETTGNPGTWILQGDGGAGGGEANTASNVGTVGTGIFKQKTGVDLELYKLNAASNKLSIALNGTDRIDLDVAEGNLTLGNLGGTLGPTKGGTGLASYALGDVLYSSAANTLAALAGNTTTTKMFMRQTGNGTVSAAPAWEEVDLGTDTAGNFVASVATNSPLTGGAGGSEGPALTLGITANGIDGSHIADGYAGRSLTETSNVLDADTELYTRVTTAVLESPVATDDGIIQLKFPTAITITRVTCSTNAGTVDIQLDERAEGTPNTAGTDVLGSPAAALQCTTSTATQTTFNNAGIAANAPLNLDVDAVASSPGVVRIHIAYTVDD